MNQDSANQTASGRDVFVSYASHDAAVANSVVEHLEGKGIKCWIAPRDVVPGTLYADGIVGAIDESRVLVLILSKDAVSSAHVGKELERATSKRHPIIALRLDTAPLTRAFEYFLNESQWIEVGAVNTDAAIEKVVAAVGQHLSPGTATSWTNGIQASAGRRKVATPRRAWVIAAVVVAVLLAGGYLLDKVWRSKHETTASTSVASDKSIAILPFTDMSEKKDQEYFADGMAEEIIDLLVKIPGIKVIGRTSSFQFKGKIEDFRSIGTKLGVAYVLQGSVRKSGDHLRVTAQLLNSRDGTHLWSGSFGRDLSDVFKMQDEIAAGIVRALQIEVSYGGIIPRPELRNTEAYTLYLQGLHALNRFDQQGAEQAANYFQRALDLDPSFAASADALASAYFVLGQFGFLAPSVAFEKGRAAANLALTLDPSLATAHAQLNRIHRAYDWDWPAADREIKLALAGSPNNSFILFMAAVQSLTMGHWDGALKQVNATLAQDPLDPTVYFILSWIQTRRDRLPEAEAATRRTLEISPTFSRAHFYLGRVLLARNQPQAALIEMQKEADDATRLGGTAMAYFALGRKAESDAALAQMVKDQAEHNPFHIAQVYAFRGASDQALKWLDRAYEQRDVGLSHIKGEPTLKKLESDPRYKAFLKKMNLPEG